MEADELIYELQKLLNGEKDEIRIIDEAAGLNKVKITSVYRADDFIIIDTSDFSGLV